MKELRKYCALFIALILASNLSAQRVSVNIEPRSVSVGDNFRLEYKIGTDKAAGIRNPNFKGFEVLGGPFSSTFSNYQIVNGHSSSSSSTTYTFILAPTQAGSLVIPPTVISVGGRSVTTPAVRVNVGKGHGSRHQSAVGQNSGASSPNVPIKTSGRISSSDLFITVKANKTKVFEQEPVLLTYKVYTQVNLTQLQGKMPDLKGFLTQEVKQPQQISFGAERVNGRLYRVATWSQYVMFPQQTGSLKIPSIRFDGVVTQIDRSIDPIDAFFNGGADAYNVKVSRNAPSLNIQVLPLPAKPANFSGGVGTLNVKGEVVTAHPKTNDALTYRITVSGIGNMKLIKTPTVKFPASFEVYDPKVTDETKLTANGIEGKMVFDYLVVPKQMGKFTIPSTDFVYFDVSTNTYKTLKTGNATVMVGKGTKSDADVENDLKLRNSDIHPIHTSSVSLKPKGYLFWGSLGFVLLNVSLLILFVVALIVLLRFRKVMADVEGRKEKGAGKYARARMKKSKGLMTAGKEDAFYEEISKALLRYAADRLHMNNADLNKENIVGILRENQITDEAAHRFIDVLERCEFARFAPRKDGSQMGDIYQSSLSAIDLLETEFKKK